MMKKTWLILTMVLMSITSTNAQNVKTTDKDLTGSWMLEWIQYDGEKKMMCGKESKYSSFKYYGSDGEYACAEVVLSSDGKVVVLPHEYGTYTYKNGVYTEMGRPTVKDGLIMVDKTHFKGHWKNRTESWQKRNIPDNVVQYIVNACKTKNTPAYVQNFMKQNVFK